MIDADIIPITVGTCCDSEPGDEGCQQGTRSDKCSLRAAVEYCTKPQFHGKLCPIAMPPGTYEVANGAINITRGGETEDESAPVVQIVGSSSGEKPLDCNTPCVGGAATGGATVSRGLRPGLKRRLPWSSSWPSSSRSPPPPPPQPQNPLPSSDNNFARIDGTTQADDERLFNVFPGTMLTLQTLDISNFGGSGLLYGGAVYNRGTFYANDVGFTGNHATFGAVVYNGVFDSPSNSSSAKLTIKDDTCSNNTQGHVGADVFNSQNGTAIITCSTCSTEGDVKKSLTCAPTSRPSPAPSFAAISAAPSFVPTAAVPVGGDDVADGEDSPSTRSTGAITVAQAAWLGGAVVMIMALLLCSVVYCRRKKRRGDRPKQGAYDAVAGGGVDLSSSLLPSPHQPPTGAHDGAGGSEGGGQSRVSSGEKHVPVSMHATTHRLTGVSIDEMSVVAEPLLGALESMTGHPMDWLIDMRALQLGRMIGVGSSAHVFEATYFGQFVAAKRLPALSWDRADVEAFIKQEAGLLVHLHHPRVIKFYGVALVDDYVYMVSELCRGSLTQLLEQANASGVLLPIDLLLSLSVGIARGIEFLHSRGVVHRDIKPDNGKHASSERAGPLSILGIHFSIHLSMPVPHASVPNQQPTVSLYFVGGGS